jgi:hypothetical protein
MPGPALDLCNNFLRMPSECRVMAAADQGKYSSQTFFPVDNETLPFIYPVIFVPDCELVLILKNSVKMLQLCLTNRIFGFFGKKYRI